MAQMTRLALFGPFFVFMGQHWPSLAVVEVEVVELKPNRKYQQDHVTSEFERT